MEIILYSVVAFFISLIIQIIFILIIHSRKKNENAKTDVEEEYKRNMKLVIKIIIAIIISVIISVITFYTLGIAVICFLRQGH